MSQPSRWPSSPAVPTDTAVVEEPAAPAEPVAADAEARSNERWELIVAGDWIQAYDFGLPQIRAAQPLGNFLTGKENHEYRNPSKAKVIGGEDDVAYLELRLSEEKNRDDKQRASEGD